MSAAKFTPGPWTVDTEGRAPWVWIGDFAVHVPSFEDARLIAAAPELLKALQGLGLPAPREGLRAAFVADAWAVWDDWIAKRRAAARAAIAKALGSAS